MALSGFSHVNAVTHFSPDVADCDQAIQLAALGGRGGQRIDRTRDVGAELEIPQQRAIPVQRARDRELQVDAAWLVQDGSHPPCQIARQGVAGLPCHHARQQRGVHGHPDGSGHRARLVREQADQPLESRGSTTPSC